MIIYKIQNKEDGKIYIGQTKERLSKRFLGHYHNKSHDSHLSNAMRKYGRDKFTIEQIDIAETQEELDLKEIYWISFYNSMDREKGYNILPGGGGRSHTEESRQKMSESRKGKKQSKECILKRIDSMKDYKHTEETKLKISIGNRGKKKRAWTEEEKKAIGERSKGRKHSPESIQRMKEAQAKHTERKKAYTFTEEHKRKLREARAKRVFTKEDRRKISEGLKGRKHSPETIAKIQKSRKRIREQKKNLTNLPEE